MKVIGIIGGIASGKSTVSRAMRSLGAGHINADEIGHDVIEIPEIVQQMKARWADRGHITDRLGKVRRDIVANIIFNDSQELEFLDAICSSPIKSRIQDSLSYFHPDYTQAVILDAPLLLEANWNRMCDIIIYVEASKEARVERAGQREDCPLDALELTKREAAQFDLTMKEEFSSHTIDNSGDWPATMKQVQSFWSEVINV